VRALTEINALTPAEFVAAFGDVAEHSPWVAETAAGRRPFASREAMIEAFAEAVRSAPSDAKLALLRAHPDLATRAKVTAASAREQAGAGLTALTADEFRHFTQLNGRYREKYGFPFIYAVKGATKGDILASFEQRLANDWQEEFSIALEQVCRILRFRLEELVAP
jgi:2-oxo-4-hydroxy-4-carboxy-5-ureidoimidazoline decarboxylase